MNETLQLTQTQIGDLPRRRGLLLKLGVPEIYARKIKEQGLHAGLSGGWLLAVWLAFVLTASAHPKYQVADGVARHADLLALLTGQKMRAVAFNDQRLASLLSRLSRPEHWEPFEAARWDQSVTVYQMLSPGVGGLYRAHCDSTTGSGYHCVHQNGVMPRGHEP